MGTRIRPEVSESNRYWIEKHRYYELKHFCLQYPIWRKSRMSLDGMSRRPVDPVIFSQISTVSDPTARCAEARRYYAERMEMVENAARETDPELGGYLLRAITEGISYDNLKSRLDIPCCKDVYYDLYRRFFWLLSRARK